MIVQKGTPANYSDGLTAGVSRIVDCLGYESMFIAIANQSGVAATVTITGAIGGINVFTIANAVAIGVGQTVAFSLSQYFSGSLLAAAAIPAAGAFNAFLPMPTLVVITTTQNCLLMVRKSER